MVRRAGAGQACGPAPDTPRAAALGRRSPCLTSLPRYQWTRAVRPGMSPALQLPYEAEDGPVSTRPAVVGVGGEEHSDSPYRGTARRSTRRAAQRGMGRRLLTTYRRRTRSGQGVLPVGRAVQEAVQRVHEKAGHPADEIYELPVEV